MNTHQNIESRAPFHVGPAAEFERRVCEYDVPGTARRSAAGQQTASFSLALPAAAVAGERSPCLAPISVRGRVRDVFGDAVVIGRGGGGEWWTV